MTLSLLAGGDLKTAVHFAVSADVIVVVHRVHASQRRPMRMSGGLCEVRFALTYGFVTSSLRRRTKAGLGGRRDTVRLDGVYQPWSRRRPLTDVRYSALLKTYYCRSKAALLQMSLCGVGADVTWGM